MFLQYKPLLDYNAVDFHKHMGMRSISVLLDDIEDSSVGAFMINPLSLMLVWPHFCYKKSALLLSTHLVVPRLMLYIKLPVNLIVQEFNLVWLNAGTLHISW
jgi:hypothetical protein